MKNCRDCKHFYPNVPDVAEQPDETVFSLCTTINEFSLLALVDHSAFYVKPAFGCILWEPK